MSPEEFQQLVDRALDEVPETLQPYLEGLAIEVQPGPDRRTRREMGLSAGQARSLMGLYVGTPITEHSVTDPVHWPDRIVIYRDNVQRCCRTKGEVVEQVRTTVLHEIGHHFGLEEDDLQALGYD